MKLAARVEPAGAARAAVEHAARESYSRLLAWLARRFGDLTEAEDALADALLAALSVWSERGVPDKPEAWLLSCARNRILMGLRRQRCRDFDTELAGLMAPDADPALHGARLPDERLPLLFVCAHPAIDAALHTPLMLQTVLGFDAAQIGAACLVAPTTMGQRLVRAKQRIRAVGIGFELPELRELPARLHAVLEAIYALYSHAWNGVEGADPRASDLADEALWLAALLVELLPDQAEALGLYALLLHSTARRAARRDASGAFVPLSAQDPTQWNGQHIELAERLLSRASSLKSLGPFQFEAAIQSAHNQRRHSGRTPWLAVLKLYEGLCQLAPTLGAELGRIAALAEVYGPAPALAELEHLPAASVAQHQPYWALRAELLTRVGRAAGAAVAYRRAIGLCEDDAVRRYLLMRSQEVR